MNYNGEIMKISPIKISLLNLVQPFSRGIFFEIGVGVYRLYAGFRTIANGKSQGAGDYSGIYGCTTGYGTVTCRQT